VSPEPPEVPFEAFWTSVEKAQALRNIVLNMLQLYYESSHIYYHQYIYALFEWRGIDREGSS
jgi:hypothetical protein